MYTQICLSVWVTLACTYAVVYIDSAELVVARQTWLVQCVLAREVRFKFDFAMP